MVEGRGVVSIMSTPRACWTTSTIPGVHRNRHRLLGRERNTNIERGGSGRESMAERERGEEKEREGGEGERGGERDGRWREREE